MGWLQLLAAWKKTPRGLSRGPDSTLMTYWVCPEGPAARFNPKAEQDSKKGSGHLLEPSQAPTSTLGGARLENR